MALNVNFNVESLSPLHKKLLLILPPLALIVFAVFFFVLPANDEIKRLNGEIEKQEADIRLAQQKAEKLASLISENERLKKQLSELQLQLPVEREVSTLLKQVEEIGIASGLQVVAWKPRDKMVHVSKEIYEIPVDVEMRGNYHRIGQFFSSITGLSRIVNISNVSMKAMGQRPQRSAMQLATSFTAMTYSLIPEAERQAMEKEEGKKK